MSENSANVKITRLLNPTSCLKKNKHTGINRESREKEKILIIKTLTTEDDWQFFLINDINCW